MYLSPKTFTFRIHSWLEKYKGYLAVQFGWPIYNFAFCCFPGESGLGKSTLLNSLFLTDLYTPSSYPSVEEKMKKTVSVGVHTLSGMMGNQYKNHCNSCPKYPSCHSECEPVDIILLPCEAPRVRALDILF